MKKLMYTCVWMFLFVTLAATLALAQDGSAGGEGGNTPTALEKDNPPLADILPDTRFETTLICTLVRPSQVQRYNVQCSNARRVDVQIADCIRHRQLNHR